MKKKAAEKVSIDGCKDLLICKTMHEYGRTEVSVYGIYDDICTNMLGGREIGSNYASHCTVSMDEIERNDARQILMEIDRYVPSATKEFFDKRVLWLNHSLVIYGHLVNILTKGLHRKKTTYTFEYPYDVDLSTPAGKALYKEVITYNYVTKLTAAAEIKMAQIIAQMKYVDSLITSPTCNPQLFKAVRDSMDMLRSEVDLTDGDIGGLFGMRKTDNMTFEELYDAWYIVYSDDSLDPATSALFRKYTYQNVYLGHVPDVLQAIDKYKPNTQ